MKPIFWYCLNVLLKLPGICNSFTSLLSSIFDIMFTGFMLDNKNFEFILIDDEKIYDFLSEGINEYMRKFEVLASEDFSC